MRDDCFFFVRPHRTQRLCPCSATSAQPAAQPPTPMTSFDASTLRTPPSSSASWSKAGSGLRIQHTQSVSISFITTQAEPSLALPIVCVGHGCDPSHAGKSDARTHTHMYIDSFSTVRVTGRWDDLGYPVNDWDSQEMDFVLSRAMVAQLQAEGKREAGQG